MKTKFYVKCEGWTSADLENPVPLQYKFYAVKNDGKSKFLLWAGWKAISDPLTLGIGDPSKDYNRTIFVEVIDIYGSSSSIEIPLQVGLHNSKTTIVMSWLLAYHMIFHVVHVLWNVMGILHDHVICALIMWYVMAYYMTM